MTANDETSHAFPFMVHLLAQMLSVPCWVVPTSRSLSRSVTSAADTKKGDLGDFDAFHPP